VLLNKRNQPSFINIEFTLSYICVNTFNWNICQTHHINAKDSLKIDRMDWKIDSELLKIRVKPVVNWFFRDDRARERDWSRRAPLRCHPPRGMKSSVSAITRVTLVGKRYIPSTRTTIRDYDQASFTSGCHKRRASAPIRARVMTEEIKQDRRSHICRRSTTIPPFRYRGRDHWLWNCVVCRPSAISWIVYNTAHVLTEGGGNFHFQEIASHNLCALRVSIINFM